MHTTNFSRLRYLRVLALVHSSSCRDFQCVMFPSSAVGIPENSHSFYTKNSIFCLIPLVLTRCVICVQTKLNWERIETWAGRAVQSSIVLLIDNKLLPAENCRCFQRLHLMNILRWVYHGSGGRSTMWLFATLVICFFWYFVDQIGFCLQMYTFAGNLDLIYCELLKWIKFH